MAESYLWQSEIDHWGVIKGAALNDIELAQSRVEFAERMIGTLIQESLDEVEV